MALGRRGELVPPGWTVWDQLTVLTLYLVRQNVAKVWNLLHKVLRPDHKLLANARPLPRGVGNELRAAGRRLGTREALSSRTVGQEGNGN